MKPVENPTKFFMRQAEEVGEPYKKEIQEFTAKLLDKKRCLLCREQYTMHQRVPRIMVHCGHTFCTPCLTNFYFNQRIRCPMCLKLIKHLSTLELLPINHGIFEEVVEQDIKACDRYGEIPEIKDAKEYLFAEYERSRKQALYKQRPPQIQPNSGLPFCPLHPDRVEHFFCAPHKNAGCRTCVQVGHVRPTCKVIDLYQIENPSQLYGYHNMYKESEEPHSDYNLDDSDNLDSFANQNIEFGDQRIKP